METRNLPVQLEEAEIKAKGEELAKIIDAHTKLEDEKKSSLKVFTEQLKRSSAEIRRLAKTVETGKEYREVPIKAEYFPGKNLCKIFRTDTGELVEARSMTAEEYQLEFFDDEGEVILDDRENFKE